MRAEAWGVKITRTEVIVLGDPPPSEPVDHRIDALAFLRVHTDEGIRGLSEVFAVPPGVAKAVLDGPDSFFGRLLVGEDPIAPERLWTCLYNSMLHGNRRGWAIMCLGAVDVALWDIFGKSLGRPVYQLLGGSERSRDQIWSEAQRTEVVPCCTIWCKDFDRPNLLAQQIAKVETLRDLGYRAVKVEPAYSAPETVVELARLARETMGPDRMVAVDVAYLWNDAALALRVANQLAALDVFFLETPFPVDSLAAYAYLTARSPIRIAAGEHTTTRWEFLDLMDRGGVTVVQPYMTTVGGLTEAKRVVELAQPRGVLVCPGNWGTQVLGAASAHLAAYSPITPYVEYGAAQVFWSPLRKAIQEVALPVVDGAVPLPTSPGLGVDLPDDLIAHFRLDGDDRRIASAGFWASPEIASGSAEP
jgi:L-alanine-DL-glutamate epimerase-like enolase superfamily enzyme